MDYDKLTRKIAKWATLLQEFNFEVINKAMLQNLEVDGLNCNPYHLLNSTIRLVNKLKHASRYLKWMVNPTIL